MTKSDSRFESSIPPPPSSRRRLPATETTFFEDLFLDLSLRIEWLGQVLDSVPERDTATAALATLRGYTKALKELAKALEFLQSHAKDVRFAALFSLDGALAAYISRLYAWCEEITADFENVAVGLRKQEPVWAVFSHRAVAGSYEHFETLGASLRKELARARTSSNVDAKDWAQFDSHLEELFWATEWLHLGMAKRPGD